MDNLTIQDVFEPYYAGRKRFPAPKDSAQPITAKSSWLKKPVLHRPPADDGLSTETDSAMEH